MTPQRISNEVKELLEEPERGRLPWHRRGRIAAAAFVGAVIGASAGFVGLLFLFGMVFGGDGQAGLGALLIGVPAGGWAGAEIGARLEKKR